MNAECMRHELDALHYEASLRLRLLTPAFDPSWSLRPGFERRAFLFV